jgi:hypothetical protein
MTFDHSFEDKKAQKISGSVGHEKAEKKEETKEAKCSSTTK